MASAGTTKEFDPQHWHWGHDAEEPRVTHMMFRVKDLDASLRFYVDGLGMRVIKTVEIEARRATATFLGYGDLNDVVTLELATYWDRGGQGYTHGTGYGHMAVAVPDILQRVGKLESLGAEVFQPPAQFFPGGPLVCFVRDPDGYSVELIQSRRD